MALKAPEDSAAGLRDRKKVATRVALRRAALDLFEEKGFGPTSVDEIAARAEVSRSTFFRYFGSKEAVLFDPIDEQGDEFLHYLNARPPAESPWDAFRAALLSTSRPSSIDIERDREQRLLDDLLSTDPALDGRRLALSEKWTNILADVFARRGGRGDPNFEDRLAAATCMAVSEEVRRLWRARPDVPAEEMIDKAFVVLRSL